LFSRKVAKIGLRATSSDQVVRLFLGRFQIRFEQYLGRLQGLNARIILNSWRDIKTPLCREEIHRLGYQLQESGQSFYDCVMEFGANWLDRLIQAVGPGAVCEKRDGQMAVRINPEGGSGIAEVTVRARA
jgi:hypothetical protein